jgi:hypothetical protein
MNYPASWQYLETPAQKAIACRLQQQLDAVFIGDLGTVDPGFGYRR